MNRLVKKNGAWFCNTCKRYFAQEWYAKEHPDTVSDSSFSYLFPTPVILGDK